jgi:hypothetical protein
MATWGVPSYFVGKRRLLLTLQTTVEKQRRTMLPTLAK